MSGSQVKRLKKDMRQNGFDQDQPIDVADVDGRKIIHMATTEPQPRDKLE
jgi:filamentous hemagglutinin